MFAELLAYGFTLRPSRYTVVGDALAFPLRTRGRSFCPHESMFVGEVDLRFYAVALQVYWGEGDALAFPLRGVVEAG